MRLGSCSRGAIGLFLFLVAPRAGDVNSSVAAVAVPVVTSAILALPPLAVAAVGSAASVVLALA